MSEETAELNISETTNGLILTLKVSPNARKPGITGLHGGMLKVAVKAVPEKGKANHEVIALLSAALDLPAHAVEILSGQTSRQKRVLLANITAGELRKRIETQK